MEVLSSQLKTHPGRGGCMHHKAEHGGAEFAGPENDGPSRRDRAQTFIVVLG